MELSLLSEGKTKEKWLQEACGEYIKRLQPRIKLSCFWAKDRVQLIRAAQCHPRLFCLDPAGVSYASEAFASFLMGELLAHSHLCFVIGGPDGLPPQLKREHPLISLSTMTLTHQCTRLILLEQIYRAFEIERGSPYHR